MGPSMGAQTPVIALFWAIKEMTIDESIIAI